MTQRVVMTFELILASAMALAATAVAPPAHAQGGAGGARQCLRIVTDKYGLTALANDCPASVSVSMCFVNPIEKTYQMVEGRRIYTLAPCEFDNRSEFVVFPGDTQGLGKPGSVANGFVWVECYDGQTYAADMVRFDRTTFTASGTCMSWATEKVVSQAKPGSSYALLGTRKPAGLSSPAQYSQRAAPPPVRLPAAQPQARPITSLAALAANGYPSAALRAEQQGRVGFELAVSPSGTVVSCRVTEPSGFPALDNGTCDLLMKRARFHPTGATGNVTYRNAINWRL